LLTPDLDVSQRSLLLEREDEEKVRDLYDIELPEVPVVEKSARASFLRVVVV
jgi:hypothetical protein